MEMPRQHFGWHRESCHQQPPPPPTAIEPVADSTQTLRRRLRRQERHRRSHLSLRSHPDPSSSPGPAVRCEAVVRGLVHPASSCPRVHSSCTCKGNVNPSHEGDFPLRHYWLIQNGGKAMLKTVVVLLTLAMFLVGSSLGFARSHEVGEANPCNPCNPCNPEDGDGN